MNRKEMTINNKGVNIHALIFNASEKEVPIVCVPGATNSAEDIEEGFAGKLSHYHIIISIRGRGKSDAPERGYSLEEQASDVLAVVAHLQLSQYYLFGYSMGVGIAIRAATKDKEKVQGIILGDYPPVNPPVDENWAKNVKQNQPELRDAFLNGMVNDGAFENLFPELQALTCPLMLVKGGQEDSLFPDQILPTFKEKNPTCKVIVLADSGHDIFLPKPQELVDEIMAFIKDIESV